MKKMNSNWYIMKRDKWTICFMNFGLLFLNEKINWFLVVPSLPKIGKHIKTHIFQRTPERVYVFYIYNRLS